MTQTAPGPRITAGLAASAAMDEGCPPPPRPAVATRRSSLPPLKRLLAFLTAVACCCHCCWISPTADALVFPSVSVKRLNNPIRLQRITTPSHPRRSTAAHPSARRSRLVLVCRNQVTAELLLKDDDNDASARSSASNSRRSRRGPNGRRWSGPRKINRNGTAGSTTTATENGC